MLWNRHLKNDLAHVIFGQIAECNLPWIVFNIKFMTNLSCKNLYNSHISTSPTEPYYFLLMYVHQSHIII